MPLANRVTCLRHHMVVAAMAEERLGRDVVLDHDRGVHGRKVQLRNMLKSPHWWLKYQPAFVHLEEDIGGLPALRLPLAPGNEQTPLHGHVELHRGEDGADRCPSGTLHEKLAEARQLNDAGKTGFMIEKRMGTIDVPAPVQGVRRWKVQHLAIGEE